LAEQTRKAGVEVWSYRLMPDHVHLILTPGSAEGIGRAVGTNWIWYNMYPVDVFLMAKPEMPHARVADPSRVDGVRPWAGPSISATGRGEENGFESGQLGNGPRTDGKPASRRPTLKDSFARMESQLYCPDSTCTVLAPRLASTLRGLPRS
jgi:hypothetical protein